MQTKRHADETTCRRNDMQTKRHADETTCRRNDMHTKRHADETTCRRNDMQTKRHADETTCRQTSERYNWRVDRLLMWWQVHDITLQTRLTDSLRMFKISNVMNWKANPCQTAAFDSHVVENSLSIHGKM